MSTAPHPFTIDMTGLVDSLREYVRSPADYASPIFTGHGRFTSSAETARATRAHEVAMSKRVALRFQVLPVIENATTGIVGSLRVNWSITSASGVPRDKVDEVRCSSIDDAFRETLKSLTFEGDGRVFIVYPCDRLSVGYDEHADPWSIDLLY